MKIAKRKKRPTTDGGSKVVLSGERRKQLNDIASKIVPVRSLQGHRSWAIYGRSGSGKTTFASTFPQKVLLLDIKDKGTDSIRDAKGVDVCPIDDWEELEEVYEFFVQNPGKYKTVVFDTITQLQQLCLSHVTGQTERVGDWGSVTKREFGEVAGLMKDWIVNFRDLPLEVVFLAQERKTGGVDEDENPDQMIVPEVGPQVMPSIAVVLNAAVSIIGNTFIRRHYSRKKVKGGTKVIEKEEARYAMRIGPNPVYVTKLRKPKQIEAPSYIEDPTYADVVEIINEAGE